MLLQAYHRIRFEDYVIDRPGWTLEWRDEPIALNRRSFDLLLYLIDHRDRVAGKDELLHALWADQFVEESNLTQHIFLLRKALSRHDSGKRIIETIPGRGYRFTAPVEMELRPGAEEQVNQHDQQIVLRATESITRITFEEEEIEAIDTNETNSANDVNGALSTGSPHPALKTKTAARALTASLGVAAILLGGWLLRQRWLDHSGGAPVQLVLMPMEGSTGDVILDKSLTQALRMDLSQSPYVSVISNSLVQNTLAQMMRKPDEAMTPAMAREVCERTNSQGVLSSSIARVGQHFLITEEASNCVDGSIVAAARYEAAQVEDLPHAMDKLAATLRQKLGESRRSIARFDVPLFHDNTPSLEALKAFTQGTQDIREGKFPEAIALLKAAVAADPQFAGAHYNLAAAYASAGDDLHVRESIAKAYALKDTAMKPTQFAIATMYDSEYTGDMYELVRSFHNWVDLYPNSSQAWSGLANAQRDLSMDSEALASSLRTVELLPHSQGMLANLVLDQTRNNDLKGARATCERAIHDNLDGDGIRVRYLLLAYLLHDQALLQAQRAWLVAHPQSVAVLGEETQIAMAEGRFADARRLIARTRDLHHEQGLSGPDDERAKFQAVDLMQVGDLEAGKKIFQESPVDSEEGQEVLGLVFTGDVPAAQAALRANQAKYPQATMIKLFWVPRTNAAIAMAQHRPADAAALLEIARPFDKIGHGVPWSRGMAYLAAGQPGLAEKDFRTVLDHPEFDPTSPFLSLSWLGLGESLAAQGNRPAAREAFQHFLGLWAHADPDALYLRRARQDLAALQTVSSSK